MTPEIHDQQGNDQETDGTHGDNMLAPEEFSRRSELYTVRGRRRIEAFKRALDEGGIWGIQREVEESLGFIHGLRYGVNARRYRIDQAKKDSRPVEDLKGMFENIEDASNRPEAQHLVAALHDEIENSLRNKNLIYQDII